MNFTPAFERAVSHAMLYEVGPWFNPNDAETVAGLYGTSQQRHKVGYVNDPKDAGGETKFGIAKNSHPQINIGSLTWEAAKAMYFDEYWSNSGCELLPDTVAVLHFDGAVNHGIGRAGRFLQQAVGALPQDGVVGKGTARMVAAYNPLDVCRLVCDIREKFYRDIVAKRPDQARFLAGWLTRINDMRAFCG